MDIRLARVLIALSVCCVACIALSPRAARAGPQSGTLTVNGSGDTNASDGFLTLREAMLIANGGTGASGLNRALSAGEAAQLSGCTINGSNLITGGCGAGAADDVRFASALTATISSPLPTLTDARTDISGLVGFGIARVDAQGMAAGDAFTIDGDEIGIRNLNVYNYPTGGVAIRVLSGVRNSIQNNTLGVIRFQQDCSAVLRKGFHGIRIESAVTSSSLQTPTLWIGGNTVGCHLNSGILVRGADQVRIGYTANGDPASNFIGGYASGGQPYDLGNAANGVYLLADTNVSPADPANDNQIDNSIIVANGGRGILVRGTGDTSIDSSNYIRGNRIGVAADGTPMGNASDGVKFERGVLFGRVGGLAEEEANVINNNGANGIVVEDSSGIDLGGNYIGVLSDTAQAQGNVGHGIYVSDSQNIKIGALSTFVMRPSRNVIVDSGGDGVRIEGGQQNLVFSNTIGAHFIGSTAYTLPNAGDGVRLGRATHGNLVGNEDFKRGNAIRGNAGYGVQVVEGSYSNLIGGFNGIAGNGRGGVRLAGGMFNRVGTVTQTNTITDNAGPGVLVESDQSTVDNTKIERNAGSGVVVSMTEGTRVLDSDIQANKEHGIELRGALATGSLISGTFLFRNARDGISEHSGATDNEWRAANMFGNGGLGIDKLAANPAANVVDAPFPVITAVTRTHIGINELITVTGKIVPPAGPGTFLVSVEVLITDRPPDPSGHGEGWVSLGSTFAGAGGTWQLSTLYYPGLIPVGCLTAFQTLYNIGLNTRNSSEFGPNYCTNRSYLPNTTRAAVAGW